MPIGDTLTMTLGGSGGTAKVLNKTNDANYKGSYFLREATEDHSVVVDHVVPSSRDGSRETHRMRYDRNFYDATTLALLRTESVWVGFETRAASQNDTELTKDAKALAYVLDATLIGKLIGRQS